MGIRFGEPVVIVSGLPRSGTSLMMQMLYAGGMEPATDQIRKADDDNPRGYYELEKVKELDKGGDKTWLKAYRGKVVKVISFLLRDLPLDLNYRVIFLLRDLDEVLASQNKMLERRGETGGGVSDEKMKVNYEKHLGKVKTMLEQVPNFEVLYVRYRDAVEQPDEQARRIEEFLKGAVDAKAMIEAVNKSLYRNRS